MLKVRDFFGYKNMAEFRKDWTALTEEDKRQLREGIENGTFTY